MFLFLDVVSPIPEFFIIEDNKVILKTEIVPSDTDKISDNIFQTYLKINNELNLTKKLEKIAITIGPGSYTSLRVGAAFISGIKIARDIPFYPFSVSDLFKFRSATKNIQDLAVYISSANRQKFLCFLDNNKSIQYIKIENKNFIFPPNIKKIIYNFNEFNSDKMNILQYKFSFIDELLENEEKVTFNKNDIIRPIYVSNNKILN